MLGESVLAIHSVEMGSPLLVPVKCILQARWPESYPRFFGLYLLYQRRAGIINNSPTESHFLMWF